MTMPFACAAAEEWRPVPGFKGSYEVSNLGRVRSLDRVDSAGRRLRGRVIVPAYVPRGRRRYASVHLWRGRECTSIRLHRLVAMVFLAPPPDPAADEVNHVDGDSLNNAAVNLEWCTRWRNLEDRNARQGWTPAPANEAEPVWG